MIAHVFNCGVVSGPENLVLRNLATHFRNVQKSQLWIVNLEESRSASARSSLKNLAGGLGLKYFGIPVASRWDRSALGALENFVKNQSLSLVHAHDVKASFYVSKIAQADFRKVSTHHGILGRPDFKTRAYELFYRYFLLPGFDATCAVSAADFEILRRVPGLSSKLHLHRNGASFRCLDPSSARDARIKVREQWGKEFPTLAKSNLSAFWVGLVGRLSAEKNQKAALEAVAQLRSESRSKLRLLLFGQGPDEASLKNLSAHLGLDCNVIFMGQRPDMLNEYAGLDLLIVTSKAEGLPMNLLEAAASGVPVAATPVGGIPDLIPDPSVGYLLRGLDNLAQQLAERFESLIHHRELLPSVGSKFQERAKALFSGEEWTQKLLRIYAQLGVVLADSQGA